MNIWLVICSLQYEVMSRPRSLFPRFSRLFLFAAIFRSVPQYNPVWSSGGWTGEPRGNSSQGVETPPRWAGNPTVQVLQQSVSIPVSTQCFSFYLICLQHGGISHIYIYVFPLSLWGFDCRFLLIKCRGSSVWRGLGWEAEGHGFESRCGQKLERSCGGRWK